MAEKTVVICDACGSEGDITIAGEYVKVPAFNEKNRLCFVEIDVCLRHRGMIGELLHNLAMAAHYQRGYDELEPTGFEPCLPDGNGDAHGAGDEAEDDEPDSGEHETEMRVPDEDTLGNVVADMRKNGRPPEKNEREPETKRAPRKRGSSKEAGELGRQIREWAAQHGFEAKPGGRMRKEVLEAVQEAEPDLYAAYLKAKGG